jgi:hypothetical protein
MTFKVDEKHIDIIYWVDAEASSGWESSIEVALAHAVTVGYVVAEDKTAVCIASTWSSPHSNCRMTIPKAWIKHRQCIKLPVIKAPLKPVKKEIKKEVVNAQQGE